MASRTGLSAAALLLSISGALACDDFDEETALLAAQAAAKPAQIADVQAAPGAQSVPLTGQPEATNMASVKPRAMLPETATEQASAVAR